MATENQNVNVVVTKSPKSVGIAIALSLFFGPLGMFYSTVLGAIVMIIVNLIVGLLTFGLVLILTIPSGVMWAAIAANSHNKQLMAGKI